MGSQATAPLTIQCGLNLYSGSAQRNDSLEVSSVATQMLVAGNRNWPRIKGIENDDDCGCIQIKHIV